MKGGMRVNQKSALSETTNWGPHGPEIDNETKQEEGLK